MSHAPVILIGAGGHALVVLDALLQSRRNVLGLVDIDPGMRGRRLLGIEVLGDEGVLARHAPRSVQLVNGIGSTASLARRRGVYERLSAAGYEFIGVVHASAILSPHAKVAGSAQIMAGAVVQTHAEVGENSIVNTGATIDHGCAIGAHVHVAPGVTLSGNVTIGDGSHVGAGATVIQGITIGASCTIAAGALVVGSFPPGAHVAGVPARETRA